VIQGRWWLFLGACLASLAAGWFLALRFGVEPGAGAAARTDAATGVAASATPRPAAALSVDDLRRVVREELAAAGGPAATGRSDPPQVPAASPELTVAQVSAQQRASQLIDAAITRRQWTDDDVDALQGLFHQLNPDQQAEVLRQYAVAVNQGRLVPQTDRIPF
jgi:hypothetical protein